MQTKTVLALAGGALLALALAVAAAVVLFGGPRGEFADQLARIDAGCAHDHPPGPDREACRADLRANLTDPAR